MKTTKVADGKGRIVLGHQFAGRMFIIDSNDPTKIVLTLAVAVPEHLYKESKNAEVLQVREGD